MSSNAALQQTLLTAAFAARDEALPAWRCWERDSDWQVHVDFDSYLLLPRVYHNLSKSGVEGSVEDALFGRLKGIIRQNWVNNTRHLAMLKALTDSNSLPPEHLLLLPPFSLICQDRSIAFNHELPALWLPHRSDLPHLTRDLREGGWITPGKHIPQWCLNGFAAAASSLTWEHSEHSLLRIDWAVSGDDAPWQPGDNYTTVSLGDLRFHGFCPADTVSYLLLAPGLGSPFRRCAQAMLYLQNTGSEEGWRRLLKQLHAEASPLLAAAIALSPPGAKTIEDTPGTELPCPVVAGSGRQPFFRKQRQHWLGLRDDVGVEAGTLKVLQALPGYLMGKWGLAQLAQIPRRLLRGLLSDYRHRTRDKVH